MSGVCDEGIYFLPSVFWVGVCAFLESEMWKIGKLVKPYL